MGKRLLLNARRQRFVDIYYNEAAGNATKAAELAGFGSPKAAGSRLNKELAKELEHKRLELASASQVSAKEALELLANVARNSSHKDHLRALELLLKVHGMLSDKLQVTVDRKQLLGELDRQLTRLGVTEADAPKLLSQ